MDSDIGNAFGFSANQQGVFNVRTGGGAKRSEVVYEAQRRAMMGQLERQSWYTGVKGDLQPGVAFNRAPQPVEAYRARHNHPQPVLSILSEKRRHEGAMEQQLYVSSLHTENEGNPFEQQQKVGVSALVESDVKHYNDEDLAEMLNASDNEGEDGLVYNRYTAKASGEDFIKAPDGHREMLLTRVKNTKPISRSDARKQKLRELLFSA